MEGGSPTIVTNAEGGRTTPSVVAYTKNGDRLVGQVRAKRVSSLFYPSTRRVGTSRGFFFRRMGIWSRGTTGAPMKKKRVDSARRVLAASALASERHLPFASSSRNFSDPKPTTPV
jgi:hypothetical protein